MILSDFGIAFFGAVLCVLSGTHAFAVMFGVGEVLQLVQSRYQRSRRYVIKRQLIKGPR